MDTNCTYNIRSLHEKNLSCENRQFFCPLADAANTNPFSDDYQKLRLKIADCDASVPTSEPVNSIVARVAEKLRKLEIEDRADFTRYYLQVSSWEISFD